MKIFARRSNVDSLPQNGEETLLLEGDWADDERAAWRWSLDAAIDARHEWIDLEAAGIGEVLAADLEPGALAAESLPEPTLAYLAALKLRYYCGKLLRWVAFCRTVRAPQPGERWELHAAGTDQDFVDLFQELCRAYGIAGRVVLRPDAPPRSAPCRGAVATSWRGILGRWLAVVPQAQLLRACEYAPAQPRDPPIQDWGRHGLRVACCGDRRLLAPVAWELRRSGCSLAWVYEHFALKTWLFFRPLGVRQLLCGPQGRPCNRFVRPMYRPFLTREGIDLGRPLWRWLCATWQQHGARWSHWLAALSRNFDGWRPEAVLLDEDATPFARSVVLAARARGARTLVVQHGAPCVRHGFSPLAADAIAVWDQASHQQLRGWGVPHERIFVTGCPRFGKTKRRVESPRVDASGSRHAARLRVLLLACLPPDDARPDTAALHLTGATHRAMLRSALSALENWPNASLTIKLHPRQIDDAPWPELMREHPLQHARLARRGSLRACLHRADVVLSCASSAGIEAAARGWPVIQLLPLGAGDILPAAAWGMIGSARTAEELTVLIRTAMRRRRRRGAHEGVHQNASQHLARLLTLSGETWPSRAITEGRSLAQSADQVREPLCLPM